MSKDDSLRDLIERVEAYNPKLSMDNRADEMPLDLDIAKAVGIAGPDWQVARGSVTGYFSGDGVGGFGNPRVLPYTRSMDAVLTLIDPGDEWELSTTYNIARATVGLNRDHQTAWPGYGEHKGGNPVLALLSASLRAHMGTGG